MIPTLVLVALLHHCFFSASKDGVVEIGVVASCLKAVFKVDVKFLVNFFFLLNRFLVNQRFLKEGSLKFDRPVHKFYSYY